jgi:hypothetical protein
METLHLRLAPALYPDQNPKEEIWGIVNFIHRLIDFPAIRTFSTPFRIENRTAVIWTWLRFTGLIWRPTHFDVVNGHCFLPCIRVNPVSEFCACR